MSRKSDFPGAGTIATGRVAVTKEDIRLLYEYERWANSRILKLVEALSQEQFTRDLGGSFPSVRDVLLHLAASKWAWLRYWKESSPSDQVLTGLFARSGSLFRPEHVATFAAVQEKWAEVEQESAEFVEGVTDEQLERMFPVRHTSMSVAHLLQHLANHSTYHRGQIAMMLRQLGAQAQGTDFAEFLLASGDSPAQQTAQSM